MRIFFVVNPNSGKGRGRRLAGQIAQYCQAQQIDHKLWLWEDPAQELGPVVDQAHALGYTHIGCVGGDGTVSQMAAALIRHGLTLCILPNGTGNALARVYGIPLAPGRALALLREGVPHRMDVGLVNGRPFVSFAGFGIDAEVSHSFSTERERSIGRYILHAFRSYQRLDDEVVTLTLSDGQQLQWRTFMFTLMNIPQFGGGFTLCPGATCSDGRMDAIGVSKFPLYYVPEVYRLVAGGRVQQLRGYRQTQFREAVIQRAAAGKAHIDGDPVLLEAEWRVSVQPQALQLLVPRGYRGGA